jgi:hypothetical protein
VVFLGGGAEGGGTGQWFCDNAVCRVLYAIVFLHATDFCIP